MQIPSTIWILAIVLALIESWSAIPLLLLAFAPGSLKLRFLDPSQGDRLIAGSAEAQTALQRLQSMGFDLLGVKVEQQLWRGEFREISTVSNARDAFGAILLSPEAKVKGIYFFTPLSGGGMVFTRGYGSQGEIEDSRTSVRNIVSSKPEDLWASHSQRVELFRQKGFTPLVNNSRESRLEATRFFYRSDYARRTARSLLRGPLVQALIFLLILLLGASLFNLVPTGPK